MLVSLACRQAHEELDPAAQLIRLQDVWTWTALCADTKLVPSWLIGPVPFDLKGTEFDRKYSRVRRHS